MLITSVNNNHIKELCRLKEKKYRDITGLFLVEGEHLVSEAIKNNLIKEVIVLDKKTFDYDGEITYVSDSIMKKLSSMDSYPNVIGVCYKRKEENVGNRVLILEDIQDPGNLGTIVRTAVAFDFDTIILSPKTVDLYNSKVVRSTQGMIFRINIITRELAPTIDMLKKDNYLILGTNVRNGIDIRNIDIPNKFALIIGNEGNGMSNDISLLCDKNVYIKINERVESLNAAVAASILLYEINNGIN